MKKKQQIMDMEYNNYTEYFSKWRNKWIKFKVVPTNGQIIELLKYKYKLR